MELALLALGALIAPGFLLIACICFLRRLQPPESYWEIALCFAIGLLSGVVLVAALSWPLDQLTYRFAHAPVALGLYEAFIMAAIPEELSRFFVLRWRLSRMPSRLIASRCLLLGAVVGLGFASLENVGYCLDTGWTTVWERSITSIPFHALAGAIVGYFVGYSITTRNLNWSLLGVLITSTLHGVNNFDPQYFYLGNPSNNTDVDFPTHGIESIFITGWPQNIVICLLASGLVVWLARRGTFQARINVAEI